MKQFFCLLAAAGCLLISGCGNSRQADSNDDSMFVSSGDAPAATQEAVPPAETVEYTVKAGDSLWTIAKDKLGNGQRYKEILELNPQITDVETIQIGTKLKLPAN